MACTLASSPEAYRQGAQDEQIMDHTRHRDLRTCWPGLQIEVRPLYDDP